MSANQKPAARPGQNRELELEAGELASLRRNILQYFTPNATFTNIA